MLSADAIFSRSRVPRDRDRPVAAARFAAVVERKLVDPPVGRCRVDPAAVGVQQRRGRRDLVAARPPRVAAGREHPQQPSGAGVDRDGSTVGGVDDDHLAAGPANQRIRREDGGRVDGPRQRNGAPAQAVDVRGVDPGREVCRVQALRRESELRPRAKRRAARGGRSVVGGRGRAGAGRDRDADGPGRRETR